MSALTTLEGELASLHALYDTAVQEKDDAITDRDAVLSQRDTTLLQLDSADMRRDEAISLRDAAIVARNEAITERDMLMVEKVTLTVERDALVLERDQLLTERDTLLAEKEACGWHVRENKEVGGRYPERCDFGVQVDIVGVAENCTAVTLTNSVATNEHISALWATPTVATSEEPGLEGSTWCETREASCTQSAETEDVLNKDGDVESAVAAMDVSQCIRAAAEEALQQSGVVFHEESGMYYDYSTGYYQDPERSLFYEPHSGTYYYYNAETAAYEFHSQVDLSQYSAVTDPTKPMEHPVNQRAKRKAAKRETSQDQLSGRHRKKNKKSDVRRRDIDDELGAQKSPSYDPDGKKNGRISRRKRASTDRVHRKQGYEPRSSKLNVKSHKFAISNNGSRQTDGGHLPVIELTKSGGSTAEKCMDSIELAVDECDDKPSTNLVLMNPAVIESDGLSSSFTCNDNVSNLGQNSSERSRKKDVLEEGELDSVISKLSPNSNEMSPQNLGLEEGELDTDNDVNLKQSQNHNNEPPINDELEDGELDASDVSSILSLDDGSAATNSSSYSGSSSDDSDDSEEERADIEREKQREIERQEKLKEDARAYPPSVRVIATASECVEVGSLFIITYLGGSMGREEGLGHAVLLPEAGVSKMHADLTYDDDLKAYTIQDHASQSGTTVNGARLGAAKTQSARRRVRHGDAVIIGTTHLELHIHHGNDTCNGCEPGVLREHARRQQDKEAAVPHDREVTRRAKVKQLKNKYGLGNIAHEPPRTSANDRAEHRRRTVGSECAVERDDVAASVHVAIDDDNKGHQLLARMGWQGCGLGAAEQGRTEPVTVSVRGSQSAGLGSTAHNVTHALDAAPGAARRAQALVKTKERFHRDDSGAHQRASSKGLAGRPLLGTTVGTTDAPRKGAMMWVKGETITANKPPDG